MIAGSTIRVVPLELSVDTRFRRRVVRLSMVSSVALGVLLWLVVATLDTDAVIVGAFLAGWVLMPGTLVASMARPKLRYGLIVPASFISIGLFAVVAGWLPADPVAATGWILLLVGVVLGGGLGLWFWYRLLPVPSALDDPFARGRWGLVAVHVGCVVLGAALAATGLM